MYLFPPVEDPLLFYCNGTPSGDHFAIRCKINLTNPQRTRKTFSFRRYIQIVLSDLNCDFRTSLHDLDGIADNQADAYDSDIRRIIWQSRTFDLKGNCSASKQLLVYWWITRFQERASKGERRWRSSTLTIHDEISLETCHRFNTLLIDQRN